MTTCPPSLFQQQAIAMERVRPDSAFSPWFTLSAVIELTGPLDRARLQAAVDTVVGRHEVLRSRLDLDGDAAQVIAPRVRVIVEEAESAELHVPVPADASSPLVVRVVGDRALTVHLHHLFADPFTLWTVVGELAALYRGEPLAAVDAQYREFAEQELTREAMVREDSLRWWESTMRDRKFAAPSSGSAEPFVVREQLLAPGEFAALRALAPRYRATTLTTLFAALTWASRRWTGGADLPFITVFSTRNQPRWRRVLGPCIRTAYLPVPAPPECFGPAYAAEVRDVVLGCQRHNLTGMAEVRALHPQLTDPATTVPFFEYIAEEHPAALCFGDVTGRVTAAAGPKDRGGAAGLAIRARADAGGALVAHLSGGGADWSLPQVRLLWRDVAGLVAAS